MGLDLRLRLLGIDALVELVRLEPDLRANLSAIQSGYRSSAYTISFLDDEAGGIQSMIMLSP